MSSAPRGLTLILSFECRSVRNRSWRFWDGACCWLRLSETQTRLAGAKDVGRRKEHKRPSWGWCLAGAILRSALLSPWPLPGIRSPDGLKRGIWARLWEQGEQGAAASSGRDVLLQTSSSRVEEQEKTPVPVRERGFKFCAMSLSSAIVPNFFLPLIEEPPPHGD